MRQASAAGGAQGARLEASRAEAAVRAERMTPAEKKKLAAEPCAAACVRMEHVVAGLVAMEQALAFSAKVPALPSSQA